MKRVFSAGVLMLAMAASVPAMAQAAQFIPGPALGPAAPVMYRYGYRRPVARAIARVPARVVLGAPVVRPYGFRPSFYGYGPGFGVGVY